MMASSGAPNRFAVTGGFAVRRQLPAAGV